MVIWYSYDHFQIVQWLLGAAQVLWRACDSDVMVHSFKVATHPLKSQWKYRGNWGHASRIWSLHRSNILLDVFFHTWNINLTFFPQTAQNIPIFFQIKILTASFKNFDTQPLECLSCNWHRFPCLFFSVPVQNVYVTKDNWCSTFISIIFQSKMAKNKQEKKL